MLTEFKLGKNHLSTERDTRHMFEVIRSNREIWQIFYLYSEKHL